MVDEMVDEMVDAEVVDVVVDKNIEVAKDKRGHNRVTPERC